MQKTEKPLGHKAYGSIGHLPGSRLGPGDKHVPEGQARICTEKRRDSRDCVVVQEKLDGSCCAVAKLNDWSIVPLGRAGYPAETSPFEQHHKFHDWVIEREGMFSRLLKPGERIVGEWMIQACGTRYDISDEHSLFVPFDIMRNGHERAPHSEFKRRLSDGSGFPVLTVPHTIVALGGEPISVEVAYDQFSKYPTLPLANGEVPEGVVYRVHRNDKVDFLAKWVRPDKIDGCYLPEISGSDPVWNWTPQTT